MLIESFMWWQWCALYGAIGGTWAILYIWHEWDRLAESYAEKCGDYFLVMILGVFIACSMMWPLRMVGKASQFIRRKDEPPC